MKQKNQFTFILGPHRSGTSLVASALHYMGVNLGSRFVDPNDDNPKGFFEDEEIVQFNDRLLRSINLSWDSFGFIWDEDFSDPRFKPYHKAAVALILDRFSGSSISGLKDPRFCILLPFWKRVISEALDAEVSYVLGIRDPDLSVLSQKARHAKDSDFHLLGRRNIQTLLLWWTYLSRALADVDPEHLMIVNYASLVDAPELQLQRLAKFLKVEQSQQETEHFCLEHVEPLLNRSRDMGKVQRRHSPLLWQYADTLYQRLLTLSEKNAIHSQDMESLLENLDVRQLEPLYFQELQHMHGYAYRKVISLRHRLIRTIHELGSEQENLQNLQTKYETLLHQHQTLGEQHEMLVYQHQILGEQHEMLDKAHQIVLNTRGWKLLAFLRRCIPWPFS